MNDLSSRSHLIFTIIIQSVNNETKQKLRSKLTFVDLAGSEKQQKAGHNSNERAKEAIEINKSLLALSRVIKSLTSEEKHIPYSDHKLT